MNFGSSSPLGNALSYPKARPQYDLNFIRNKFIPPEYTFTRNSAGTYVGADGLIKTAAANEPRFDYDPVTGECKGLLVEESRINYYRHSENPSSWITYTDVHWTNNNAPSITPNFALGPDGTNSASLLIPPAGVFSSYTRGLQPDYDYSGRYTISFFAKYAGYHVSVHAGYGGGGWGVAFNLQNGSVSQIIASEDGYVVSASTKLFPNDWVYCQVTKISGAQVRDVMFNVCNTPTLSNTKNNVTFGGVTYNLNDRWALVYVANGVSGIYLWGVQYERNNYASSYIPTSGSAVTRQPDQLVLNKNLNNQGTLYVESNPRTGIPLVADNGSNSLFISQPTNTYTRSVLYYNTNRTLRMSSDNSTPSDYIYQNPQNLNRVSLGFNRLNNNNYINGHLKKFSYYSSPLSEDNLRALTGNKTSTFRLSENIVTSGLVLYLDAGNPASYPGSGTTWTDLSGNSNDGTLVNGVGYNSGNGGSLVFDGVNDYATIPHSSSLNFPTELTISVWFYSGNVAHYLYLKGRTDADNYNPLVYTSGRYGWTGPNGRSFYNPPAGFIQGNTWYNLTVSHVSGSDPIIYKNAVPSTSHVYTEGSGARALGTNSNPVGINADVPRGSIGTFNGRIASIQAYNRALTASEIQQNFNAVRGRFGI